MLMPETAVHKDYSFIFNYYWKKPWDYLDEVIDATQTVYEQNSHTVSLSDPLKELEEQLNQIKMSLISKTACVQDSHT